MKLENYLQGLEEQGVQGEKEIVVVRNPTVDLICEKFEKWLKGVPQYHVAFEFFKELDYSVNDVGEFSLRMKECEKYRTFFLSGYFLSAMISGSAEDSFEVCINFLTKTVEGLGFENNKSVKIIGDVGACSCSDMLGGIIEIRGNAGAGLGDSMIGGIIKVSGDTKNALGLSSKGGEIYVEGKIGSIAENCKARIYHKGVQVWPR